MVTVDQAAYFVCRDERTVRRWITQGRLAEHRDASGRRVVVLREAIQLEAKIRRAPQERLMRRLAEVFSDAD